MKLLVLVIVLCGAIASKSEIDSKNLADSAPKDKPAKIEKKNLEKSKKVPSEKKKNSEPAQKPEKNQKKIEKKGSDKTGSVPPEQKSLLASKDVAKKEEKLSEAPKVDMKPEPTKEIQVPISTVEVSKPTSEAKEISTSLSAKDLPPKTEEATAKTPSEEQQKVSESEKDAKTLPTPEAKEDSLQKVTTPLNGNEFLAGLDSLAHERLPMIPIFQSENVQVLEIPELDLNSGVMQSIFSIMENVVGNIEKNLQEQQEELIDELADSKDAKETPKDTPLLTSSKPEEPAAPKVQEARLGDGLQGWQKIAFNASLGLIVLIVLLSIYYRVFLFRNKRAPFSAPMFLSPLFPMVDQTENEINELKFKYGGTEPI